MIGLARSLTGTSAFESSFVKESPTIDEDNFIGSELLYTLDFQFMKFRFNVSDYPAIKSEGSVMEGCFDEVESIDITDFWRLVGDRVETIMPKLFLSIFVVSPVPWLALIDWNIPVATFPIEDASPSAKIR